VKGRDNALLRFALGSAFIKHEKYTEAITHLEKAVDLDPHYSAAWKLYGKALAASGQRVKAARVYEQGIAAAERKGDKQAAKEMRVFLKRLQGA
jgi:uncharacterized protein HemY